MPARFCKNCIWGLKSASMDKEGVECTNPELSNIQEGNVMPLNARACHLYQALGKKKKE